MEPIDLLQRDGRLHDGFMSCVNNQKNKIEASNDTIFMK